MNALGKIREMNEISYILNACLYISIDGNPREWGMEKKGSFNSQKKRRMNVILLLWITGEVSKEPIPHPECHTCSWSSTFLHDLLLGGREEKGYSVCLSCSIPGFGPQHHKTFWTSSGVFLTTLSQHWTASLIGQAITRSGPGSP